MANKPKRSSSGISRNLIFAFIVVSLASMVVGGLIVFLITSVVIATPVQSEVVHIDCNSVVLQPTYVPADDVDTFEITATALIAQLTVDAQGDCFEGVATEPARATDAPLSSPTCVPTKPPPTRVPNPETEAFPLTATALIWQLTQDASIQLCATQQAIFNNP